MIRALLFAPRLLFALARLARRHVLWVWDLLDRHVAPRVSRAGRAVFRFVERHRRWVPPLFAVAVLLTAIVPVYAGWMGEREANRWTLVLAAVGFWLKSYLFFAMRRRMLDLRAEDGTKIPHTIFGLALIDWFGALFLAAADLAAIFTLSYYYSTSGRTTPADFAIFNRAFLNGAIAYVIATGVAVFYELRRAGTDLRVHDDGWDGRERRRRTYGRRSTDRPPA